jgi:hypothetical protein
MAKNSDKTAAPADDEATIQAELTAIQQERADFEIAQRKALVDGLTAIDVKHRNSRRRLDVARAERIKADARAADEARTAAATKADA